MNYLLESVPVQGLAYSVSGGFNTSAFDHKGLFLAGGETAAVGDFISALERVLQVNFGKVSPSSIHAHLALTAYLVINHWPL